MTFDLLVKAQRALVDGELRPATVAVRDGRIVSVTTDDANPPAAEVVELAADEVLLPGLVDTHVHVNEPGRTEWEGFATATRAAAAGGVTTIIDMPLNSIPPTTDGPALEIKRKAAQLAVHVDTGFWGGAIPGNAGELRALHEAGAFGFKCFLLPSGVDEFPPLDEAGLELAMREIASFGGLLIVHAEDGHEVTDVPPGREYQGFLASRPPAAEQRAIATLLDLAGQTGARVHVLHLSSAAALPALTAARRRGVRVTAETCPHYLSFAADGIPDGATQFKCCPPIRDAANRDALWQGLRAGDIDCVVSDHSPCTADLKHLDTGDFATAWGGIASLQLGLPAVWTAARARGIPLTDVVSWMAARPAALAGLTRKGALAPGRDADLCVFAPDDSFVVDAATLAHRNPVSAYHGQRLTGVVRRTWLRGAPTTGAPAGRLLSRMES
ncbi:MAG TPA: allantoinase AllB [Streptosporangiaceae bacterium]|jgi:allantoinase|nr:allantoinase AllB [Streptosporangiaceae bacterium]